MLESTNASSAFRDISRQPGASHADCMSTHILAEQRQRGRVALCETELAQLVVEQPSAHYPAGCYTRRAIEQPELSNAHVLAWSALHEHPLRAVTAGSGTQLTVAPVCSHSFNPTSPVYELSAVRARERRSSGLWQEAYYGRPAPPTRFQLKHVTVALRTPSPTRDLKSGTVLD